MSNQSQTLENFVRKILSCLDETDSSKLHHFYQFFNPNNCKIIFNSQPFGQPMNFLQTWQTRVVCTQHNLTLIDYHLIPGVGSLVCNINCKVRFDESGKDKAGQDSIIRDSASSSISNNTSRNRHIWGTYFGVSIQLIIDERIFNNDLNGIITGFNYNMVYNPDDSLITI